MFAEFDDIKNKKGTKMKKLIVTAFALFSFGCATTSDTPAKTKTQTNPYNSQQVIKNEVNILPPVSQNDTAKNKEVKSNEKKESNNVDVNSISVDAPIQNTPVLKKSPIVTLQVEGLGVAPADALSVPQAKIMARRAAIADAYRALAEKMYGIRVKGRETVKDLMLKNSEVRTDVYGLIRGACIQEESFKDGIYKVVMSLKLDVRKWNKYISDN